MKQTILTYCLVFAGMLATEARENPTVREEATAAPQPTETPAVQYPDSGTFQNALHGTAIQTSVTPSDTIPSARVWTLNECLRYALENNIQLQQSRNSYLSGLEDTEEAKAALLPSLTASTTQGFTNYPSTNVSDRNTYTGTYGLNADLTLYEGGKLRTTVKQQKLQNRIDALTVAESENDIRIAIVQAYLQALYATESVEVAVNTAEVSRAQRDRAEEFWKAGSISRVDFAQLESQYASDLYQVTTARTSLDNYRLQLKQLLELDITEEMNLAAPAIHESEVLSTLPAKAAIYATALEAMPEIERGKLAVESAELGIRQAQAGFYPSVSLTAGIGTGHMSNGGYESGSQIWNRFNENIGLTLNIPIFSNRRNRTAVNKARLEEANSRLTWQDLQKTLLREVETAYLDAPYRPSRSTVRRPRRSVTHARATTSRRNSSTSERRTPWS